MDLIVSRWRKSSHSDSEGNCVEVASAWLTASPRVVETGRVEGAITEPGRAAVARKVASGELVLIRDSKNLDGPWLSSSPAEWGVFLSGVRTGKFAGHPARLSDW
ncbi:DUF397 domain-containing protein [Sphaerisporangium perillae]|uniref:DUF397 domain-containing protein n=1 Tax=Sphaerisporangium perillae TaxID=2935860 RepID=UPI0020100CD8|nr:DUF397 domain-containing protein [Sphaerisporangium perillae]